MTVSELITILSKYPPDLRVGLVSLSDDTGKDDEWLTEEDIDVAPSEDDDGNTIEFLAISHSAPIPE